MTKMLNDPDTITNEEFLYLQSVIGYRKASIRREEGKKRKQQRKLLGMNLHLAEKTRLERKSDGNAENKSLQHNTKNPSQMIREDESSAAPGSGIPQNLRAGLEKLSGVDLSDVKVHRNSDKPQQVGALAYTKGNDIHMAPGQEKYLPHEGWHAVQQKQGIVKPTLQAKTGELVNDDAGLEKEADVMGNKAENGGSIDSTVKLEKYSEIKQDSKTIQRISSQEEAMRIAKENTHSENSGYSWNIKAGEYNRYVMDAQDMLRDMGYKLSKRGVDGKWSPGGETCNALLKFQKACKDTYNGLKQNAPPQTLVQVAYMQGVNPTGKLDIATYNALKKEKENKIIRIKAENEQVSKNKKELANNKKKKAAEETKQGSIDTDDVLDGIQTAIDVVGFVPGVGDVADGVNVGISIVRKDWLGAIFSGIAMIPTIGSAIATPFKAIAKASKVGKAGKFSKIVTDAIESLVKLLGGAKKVISKLSGYLNDLKGILRKLPELIKSVTDFKLVKATAGKKGIQKIIAFAKKIGNGIDTICKKADEVFTKVRNAVAPEKAVKEADDKGAAEIGSAEQSIARKVSDLKREGFQEHHIISDKNPLTKDHEIFEKAGYNDPNEFLQTQRNKIYLPKDESVYPNRSIHIGRHYQSVSQNMADQMDAALMQGELEGWTAEQYNEALSQITSSERQMLKSGERALNKNKR